MLTVSIESLIYHNKNVKLHILHPLGEILKDTVDCVKCRGLEHRFYPVNLEHYSFVKESFGHVALTAFLKFSITEVANENLVLYLGYDTIITSNIEKMFSTGFLSTPIAGVPELDPNRLTSYVNTGVLLMNLTKIKSL